MDSTTNDGNEGNTSSCASSASRDSRQPVQLKKNYKQLLNEHKARKIHLYGNGDRYFSGVYYAFLQERTKTMEALCNDLTRILKDKINLPLGVRYIFSIDGKEKILALSQIRDGRSYVCSSFDNYIEMDYDKSVSPNWCYRRKYVDNHNFKSDWSLMESKKNFDLREYIHPKIISVFRNGPKPRTVTKMVLNKRTAYLYEQVLNEISKQLNKGIIRSIYTIKGKQVKTLADFFNEDTVFIAYGLERPHPSDFDIDNEEYKLIDIHYGMQRNKMYNKPSRSTMSNPNANSRCSSTMTSASTVPRDYRSTRPKSAYFNQRRQYNDSGPGKSTLPVPSVISLKYCLGRVLGEGNFAVVCECKDRFTGEKYALKIINKNKCKGKEELIASEIAILRKVKHPNIIQMIEDFDIGLEIFLVMELVMDGDLFDAISSAKKYSERTASMMMRDLAKALRYLHSLNIAHRDVKPENVLVTFEDNDKISLKLGDFGLAIEVSEPLLTLCGSPTYVAPEIISESGYGVKVDVWAAGVITYILLCGYPPFSSNTNSEESLFCHILSGSYEFPIPHWNNISPLAKDFISGMLKINVDARMSASEMLQHQWINTQNAPDFDLQNLVVKKLNSFAEKRKSPSGFSFMTSTSLDKEYRAMHKTNSMGAK